LSKLADQIETLLSSLKVNKHDLDNENIRQPVLMEIATDLNSRIIAKRDRTKEKLKWVIANIDSQIRKNPKQFNLEKATDRSIENTIYLQDEYKDIRNEFINNNRLANKMEGVVEAFRQRKHVVIILKDLYLANYFSEPKTKQPKRSK
jgi:hypothetical protein